MVLHFFILVFSLFTGAPLSSAAESQALSVDRYLSQVQESNPGYQGKSKDSTARLAASREGDLLFSPQFYTNMQYVYDTRATLIPAIEGTTNERAIGEVGVRKQMDFGLQLELSFNINHTTFFGADPNIVVDPNRTILWVTPVFNLSLWQNFGGRMDRANALISEARAKAEAYGSGYEARAMLVEAEGRYWKLAALRETIRLQQASTTRAAAIRDLSEQKVKRRLVDDSDLLVAQAAVRGKELELRSMRDEEVTAAHNFNVARGLDSDDVGEALDFPDAESLHALKVPNRGTRRGDTRAAEQAAIAAGAGSDLAREKLLPQFNLYGSIYAVGFLFTLPLDFSLVSSMREAYAQEKRASDLVYQKKLKDEQSEWSDLIRRFESAKERLDIALDLERIQREKYANVQKRQKNGLTIAYQVFQYELDYLSSALNRVQLEGLILGLRAQMKLYEDL
jgi:outer membrane protein TolC